MVSGLGVWRFRVEGFGGVRDYGLRIWALLVFRILGSRILRVRVLNLGVWWFAG